MIVLQYISESVDPAEFDQAFSDWCSEMSDYYSAVGFYWDFWHIFSYAQKNPLIILIVSTLIIVMAFHFLPLFFRTFRR